MADLINDILYARNPRSVRGFTSDVKGCALINSGQEFADVVCACLVGEISEVALDTCAPVGLVARLPGLDYLLIYFLKKVFSNQPLKAWAVIERMPKPLLSEVLNVAARLNGSALKRGVLPEVNSEALRQLAISHLSDDDTQLRLAAKRYCDAK